MAGAGSALAWLVAAAPGIRCAPRRRLGSPTGVYSEAGSWVNGCSSGSPESQPSPEAHPSAGSAGNGGAGTSGAGTSPVPSGDDVTSQLSRNHAEAISSKMGDWPYWSSPERPCAA